jgi:hypothetical protein
MSKKTFHLSSLALLLAGSFAVYSQGFMNLDFEAANVQNLPYPGLGELVDATNGVPGWSISPTAGLNLMAHNGMPLGGAGVAILGPDWPSSQILQGNKNAR